MTVASTPKRFGVLGSGEVGQALAFNSVGSDLMVHPLLAGGPPTMFYCGNDAVAKAVVAKILERFENPPPR